MMNLFPAFRRKAQSNNFAPKTGKSMRLTRTFVETGDERCPLAGIWSRIEDCDPAIDDPEITRPAMWRLLPWRAFILRSQISSTLLAN
jgi:hypothetical protein